MGRHIWFGLGLFIISTVISTVASAGAMSRAILVDKSLLPVLEQRGLVCSVTEIHTKVEKSGKTQNYGPYRVSERLQTLGHDQFIRLEFSKGLGDRAGFFGFDLRDLRSLSQDYLYYEKHENSVDRRLEMNFSNGQGYLETDGRFGGNQPLLTKAKTRHRLWLEGCRWR